MSQQNAGKSASRALVTGTVLFYMCAALTMVMANKWVLKDTDVPLFFLLAQLLIAVVLFVAAHITGLLVVPIRPDWQVCKGLAPMIGLNVLGLSLGNYTLKYVDASFYQIARGLVLPFTVATSYLLLHSRPSLRIILACGVVTAGFFVGVFLDGTPVSLLGVFFGVMSSLTTSLHAVVIKKSLDIVKGNALDLSWYTNLLSACVLLPLLFLVGEAPGVMKLFLEETGQAEGYLNRFLLGSIIAGTVGFLMSIASLLSIKVTSPITHMVSSAVRGVAASFLGVWLFQDIMTGGRVSSIAIILGGSVWYTWIKHVESQPSSAPKAENGTYERVPLEDIEAGKVSSQVKAD